jgi:hypothetical protein
VSWRKCYRVWFYLNRSRKIQIRNIPPHLQWEVSQHHFLRGYQDIFLPGLILFIFRNWRPSLFSVKTLGPASSFFQCPVYVMYHEFGVIFVLFLYAECTLISCNLLSLVPGHQAPTNKLWNKMCTWFVAFIIWFCKRFYLSRSWFRKKKSMGNQQKWKVLC